MKYQDDDEHDREIREEVNKRTMHQSDVEHHTLKHGKDKDLMHLHNLDEGY